MSKIKIFSGNIILKLAQRIANQLNISLSNATVNRFSDGEINVQINESVRGYDIFIIQSISKPINDNLMELFIMIDALRRASANSITAVIPYFGYARQDRRADYNRVPITAKIVADFLSNVGADRVITVDLHSEQIQGFFNIPIDNLLVNNIFLEDLKQLDLYNPIVVSPDIGGVVRASFLAKLINTNNIVIINKNRPYLNISQATHIIGNVYNHDCILVDDIIDTGNTVLEAAKVLKTYSARRIFAYITHPILSGNALSNIYNSVINEIIVCDTVPLSSDIQNISKIRILTVSKMIAETINRIAEGKSVSSIFNY